MERYDEVLAKKKEEAAKQEKAQQELRQRKPVSMPMRPLQHQQGQGQGQGQSRNGAFPPNSMPPQGQQQAHFPPQQQGPILPPPRSEPQWYDKIVDALVGDAGPETKYALICTHCYHHNGLVFKEEYDTIRKLK